MSCDTKFRDSGLSDMYDAVEVSARCGKADIKGAVSYERAAAQTTVNRTRHTDDLVEARSQFMAEQKSPGAVRSAACSSAADGTAEAW